METQYKGNARYEAIEPLLRLASFPDGLRFERGGENEFVTTIDTNLTLTLCLLDPQVRMVLSQADSVVFDVTMEAFGDVGSEAYWYPFGYFLYDHLDDHLSAFSEIVERARILLNRVSFFENDSSPIASNERAHAAVNYLRLRSGVTEPWYVSLSSPFELRLDDESIGEGDGLLLEFGELPPGLDDIGECALVQLEHGTGLRWCLRPVMLSFKQTLKSAARDMTSAREHLRNIGFSNDQIKQLDATAGEVAQRYADACVWGGSVLA